MTALDEILEVVPGKRAVAVRNVPSTLSVFATHFPRFPVLPGVLILDDLVGTARLALSADGTAWELAEIERLRYPHFVQPGDRLRLTAEITAADEESVTLKATASVAGRTVTSARSLRLTRPAEVAK